MAVPLDVRSLRLSIVAARYSEKTDLEEFLSNALPRRAERTVGSDYEFVLLNDGSCDRIWRS